MNEIFTLQAKVDIKDEEKMNKFLSLFIVL
jgi:hypothetical protein